MGEVVIESHHAVAMPMGYPAIRSRLFPAKKPPVPHLKMTVMYVFQFLNGVLEIVERSRTVVLQCRQYKEFLQNVSDEEEYYYKKCLSSSWSERVF